MVTSTFGGAIAPQTSDYPKPVAKHNLYAHHDLRGLPAPDLSRIAWTNPAPSTRGKVLVVHFFQPWNPTCRRLVSTLNKWQVELEKDVVVLGVTSEAENSLRDFVRLTHPRYPLGIDAAREAWDAVGVRGYPYVMVVSPDGIVRWQGWPNDPEDKLDIRVLRQIVNATKGGK